ncbi:MAG TPA: hypothetical protein VFJ82_12085 [Longimicrobium sp.]|nr:hypothetical protein [Longimicrobium sp.]
MTTFTSEELEALRQSARARAERIARRKREIEVLRRAVWLRMDLLREITTPHPPSLTRPAVVVSAAARRGDTAAPGVQTGYAEDAAEQAMREAMEAAVSALAAVGATAAQLLEANAAGTRPGPREALAALAG